MLKKIFLAKIIFLITVGSFLGNAQELNGCSCRKGKNKDDSKVILTCDCGHDEVEERT